MPRKRVCPEFHSHFGEYPKDLLDPIVRQPPFAGLLDLAGEDEKKRRSDQERDRLRNALVSKLRLLAKHFNIKWDIANMWRELALQLALVHVPGMQIVDTPKKGRGAPRKHFRDIRDPGPLVREVNQIEAERKKGISDAVSVWKKRNKNTDSEQKLRARYYRGRRSIRNLAPLSAALEALADRSSSE
jgi:hypothetical protein